MKTAVITGASRGIGLATAKKFLAEGWKVFGTFHNTSIPLEHSNLVSVRLELPSSQSIDAAVEVIKTSNEKIDALVNNAGIVLDAHDSFIDMEKVRTTLDVDLLAVMELTQKMIPLLKPGSHIINIDSTYGSFSYPIDDMTSAGYRIAKAGLNMYTRVLAEQLREKGIVVASVDPGWVKTDMGLDSATETESPNREPEEAANDIYHLVTTVHESGNFWQFGKKRDW